MASASGLGLQADGVIMEFTRCWGYLGQVGVMARDMVNMIDGEGMENIDLQKKVHLSRIITLVEKAANIDPKEEKLKSKKCNFYNHGFCYQETSCNLGILKRFVSCMTKFVREKDATNNSNTTIDILIQNLVVVEETVVTFLVDQDPGMFSKWWKSTQLGLQNVKGQGRESLEGESMVGCQ